LDLQGIRNLNKTFKWEGVVIPTDGVKASLHYRVNDNNNNNNNNNNNEEHENQALIVVEEDGEFVIIFMILWNDKMFINLK
jgi:hypothetical protein